MNKMIVTIFSDEKNAYEGLKALKELDSEGSLTLHAAAVVAKDAEGRVSIKQADDWGPAGTIFGLATGSLLGLLGGPVGMVAGAAAGTVTGSLFDLATLGVAEDYLTEVSRNLTPGKVAIIADADEEWVTPLDTRMEALDGAVLRCARGQFVDAKIEQEMAADQTEFAALKAEYKQAAGDAKVKIKAKLEAAEKRLEARRAVLTEEINAIAQDVASRIQALQAQAARANDEIKVKLEKRIAHERTANTARVEKLRQAWKLMKEAAATR
jgi:uncharacterized membrane protein